MYILAPLVTIAVSAAIMIVIVGRKFPYLKKLPVDAAVPESGIVEGFLPEFFYFFKKIDLSFYQDLFFKELEKFLRRLRVVSLKIDSFTKQLIDKIRTKRPAAERPASEVELAFGKQSQVDESGQKAGTSNIGAGTVESFEEKQKKEEHALIIEIAKNPKSPELYKKLADLYILEENFSDAVEALETAVKLDPEDRKTAAKLRAVQKALPSK